MSSTVLGGRLPDTLFECGVKRRIGIESDRERDIQYRATLAVSPGQQLPGIIDPVTIQVIKETHTESGIDDLRQVVDRTIDRLRKHRQCQVGPEECLL